MTGCLQAPALDWVDPAMAFLDRLQGSDGGFSPSAGESSSYSLTLWVALARLAEPHPENAAWNRVQERTMQYLQGAADASTAGSTRDSSPSNLAALTVVVAARYGTDPHRFGGVDVLGRLAAYQDETGAVGRFPNEHLVGAGALARALGHEAPAARRACDGVRSTAEGNRFEVGASDVWYVAMEIQVLLACGEPSSAARVTGLLASLEAYGTSDGGYGSSPGASAADASSTANVVEAQEAWAAHANASRPAATWEAAVQALQDPDGGIRFAHAIAEPRAKTTAEVLIARGRAGLFAP